MANISWKSKSGTELNWWIVHVVINTMVSVWMFDVVMTIQLAPSPPIFNRNNQSNCSRDYHMHNCLQHIEKVTGNSSLAFPITHQQLKETCRILHRGDICTRRFINDCTEQQLNSMYREMIQGSKNVLENLCKTGKIQNDYLLHAKCFKRIALTHCLETMVLFGEVSALIGGTLNNIYENEGKSHQQLVNWARVRHLRNMSRTEDLTTWNGTSANNTTNHHYIGNLDDKQTEIHLQMFCCSYKESLDCQLYHIELNCGPSAVHFFRHYTDQMSNSLLTEHCLDYTFSNRCHTTSSSGSSDDSAQQSLPLSWEHYNPNVNGNPMVHPMSKTITISPLFENGSIKNIPVTFWQTNPNRLFPGAIKNWASSSSQRVPGIVWSMLWSLLFSPTFFKT